MYPKESNVLLESDSTHYSLLEDGKHSSVKLRATVMGSVRTSGCRVKQHGVFEACIHPCICRASEPFGI